MNNINYLNIGCGDRFHNDWINIDVFPLNPEVIHCDIMKGLPYEDNTFDAVYHSHVLEHLPKDKAIDFIKECYRVLKKSGVIRVVVPDLQKIAENYLKNLNDNLNNPDEISDMEYDWTMLEFYDQTVRNKSGGEMVEFIQKSGRKNKDFLMDRIGDTAIKILNENNDSLSLKNKLKKFLKLKFKLKINIIFDIIFSKVLFGRYREIYKIGSFRISGEVHQWMYDEYSLTRLLKETGFRNVKICSAFDSDIENWNDYALDSKDGFVYKPNSIFIEALK
ncbi:MAG: methyltransferase domain-containing protein [bacterium]